MSKGIAIALLVVGAMLIFWGVNASESFSSDVSRFFTGSGTDKSMWLLGGGAALAVVGLVTLVRSPKSA